MTRVFLSIVTLVFITAARAANVVPEIEHYKLRFVLDLQNNALSADADLRLRNAGHRPVTAIPLLLYRLFDVRSVADARGKKLEFTQRVMKLEDVPTWQVNAIRVKLPRPLAPGKTITIHLDYGGPLVGYAEVMQYVRDTIGEDYSLLRAETMPYPLVATTATGDRMRALMRVPFTYDIETIVPAGYVAVCSGNDVAEPEPHGDKTAYRCAGTTNMNVAVAKFRLLTNAGRTLRVFAMPSDADAGNRLIGEMQRVVELYRTQFGEMHRGSLTLIEIPEGWGSYALPGFIFQAAAAFKDPSAAPELYHEVGHIWNAKATGVIQRARWFDEAFASYFAALAVRQFEGEPQFEQTMERARKSFVDRASSDPRGRTTPIADYGKEELGGFSYTKGAWSLYVLNQLLGDEAFRRSMSAFLAAYAEKPAGFNDFRRSFEGSSGRNLGRWFEEWIAGTDSSAMLIDGKNVGEMVDRCR